jgi:ABC-type Zn uptake system ZnuABC Zn-binding protein ZnuA
MSKKGFFISVIIVALMLFTLFAGCAETTTSPKLKVMTGTSLVSAIVTAIGGNHVEVINLVPPSQHPGNFDVKPADIQNLSSAKLLVTQGLPGETYIDQLVASANNPNLKVVKANLLANWMIPSVQSSAVDQVLAALILVDPDNTQDYQAAAVKYKQAIADKDTELRAKLTQANVANINVIASTRQADFLTWAGFTVVGTFDSAAALTPQTVQNLVDTGKAKNVKLVVNNLQDSENAGKSIADSIGAQNLNLSNFPGGFSNTSTWAQAIDYNINLLLNAIK